MNRDFVLCGLSRSRGFSLIELMIVVSLVAIFIGIGLPALSGIHQRSVVNSATHQLQTYILSAKSAAVRSGELVQLCRLADAQNIGCAGNNRNGNPQWAFGWLLFQDNDADQQFNEQQGDVLLKVFRWPDDSCILQGRGDYIAFKPDGLIAGWGANGTFTLTCGVKRRLIKLNILGRSRSEPITDI